MTDYIKREDLLDLYTADGLPERDGGYVVPIEVVRQNILDQPAADVRPVVRGKWRAYSPLTDTYECDKCGYQVIDEIFRTNFCPSCGADMRGE